MMDNNDLIQEKEDYIDSKECPTINKDNKKILEELSQIKDDISYLRDLFVRRLSDDKQKNIVINKLMDGANFAFVEPFLYDIILLMDRLEKSEDDFVLSVREELYEILNRRGVERIKVSKEFDPSLNKAVKVSEDSMAKTLYVSGVVRNGYMFSGKVIRPAEVVVVKPKAINAEKLKTINCDNGEVQLRKDDNTNE